MTSHPRQLTFAPVNHVLTNANVWSWDGRWIVYDVRSDAAGAVFDGTRIERVDVVSGSTQVLYQAQQDACVGVATTAPDCDQVVFIHGPEHPSSDWMYGPWHRRGVIVDANRPGIAVNLDARDLMPPFTAGALRGGSHVHTYSAHPSSLGGKWVSFTYEDHVLAEANRQPSDRQQSYEKNQRGIGVSVPATFKPQHRVVVPKTHPRHHDGSHFTVLVSRTQDEPVPGSDEICRACEEAWIGDQGYVRGDGGRQTRAIAFQGEVVAPDGRHHNEVFALDLPDDLTRVGSGPLQGTPTTRPNPPAGVVQRRLTWTAERKHPGIQGPRHWLRSSPDGEHIAFLMKDDVGVVQLWTVSPRTGEPKQLTENAHDIASAFTWSPDGRWIAHVMDTSVCVTKRCTGETIRLTPPCDPPLAPRPEACVFSPDGAQIAFVCRRPEPEAADEFNQIFVVASATI